LIIQRVHHASKFPTHSYAASGSAAAGGASGAASAGAASAGAASAGAASAGGAGLTLLPVLFSRRMSALAQRASRALTLAVGEPKWMPSRTRLGAAPIKWAIANSWPEPRTKARLEGEWE
jgi:hypothetical protein